MPRVQVFKFLLSVSLVGILATAGFGIQGQTEIAVGCAVAVVAFFVASLIFGRVLTSYDRGMRRVVSNFSATAARLDELRNSKDEGTSELSTADTKRILDWMSSQVQQLQPPRSVLDEHKDLVNSVIAASSKPSAENADPNTLFRIATDVVDRGTLILERLKSIDESNWTSR